MYIAAWIYEISTLEEKFHKLSAHVYVKASIYTTHKNVFLTLTVSTILSCLFYCFTQALCKLSELDSSELTKEYKDPTDAYVIGDIIRGIFHISPTFW